MSAGYDIRSDIELPLPTAIWVLGAHLYALLVPLVLFAAVVHHWDAIIPRTDYPLVLLVAAGLMMAGSAFEISQNAIDRWYLTPETASAEGTGFCDFLFYWLIVASQGAIAIACIGSSAWVVVLVAAMVLVFPVLYLRQVAHFAPLAVLGFLAAFGAWRSFGDPVIFVQLVLSPLTMVFFGALLKTGAQLLHGFTTAAASSGVLFLAWGIHGGATEQPQSWLTVVLIVGATLLLVAICRPLMLRLPQTPRVAA